MATETLDAMVRCDDAYHTHGSLEEARACAHGDSEAAIAGLNRTIRESGAATIAEWIAQPDPVISWADCVPVQTKRDTVAEFLPIEGDYPRVVVMKVGGLAIPFSLMMTVEGDVSLGDCGFYRDLSGLVSTSLVILPI